MDYYVMNIKEYWKNEDFAEDYDEDKFIEINNRLRELVLMRLEKIREIESGGVYKFTVVKGSGSYYYAGDQLFYNINSLKKINIINK